MCDKILNCREIFFSAARLVQRSEVGGRQESACNRGPFLKQLLTRVLIIAWRSPADLCRHSHGTPLKSSAARSCRSQSMSLIQPNDWWEIKKSLSAVLSCHTAIDTSHWLLSVCVSVCVHSVCLFVIILGFSGDLCREQNTNSPPWWNIEEEWFSCRSVSWDRCAGVRRAEETFSPVHWNVATLMYYLDQTVCRRSSDPFVLIESDQSEGDVCLTPCICIWYHGPLVNASQFRNY